MAIAPSLPNRDPTLDTIPSPSPSPSPSPKNNPNPNKSLKALQQAPSNPLSEIRGRKMTIGANACPAELRRAVASPYHVIQKYSKSYYAAKQYWCKIYEVEYSLIRSPATQLFASRPPLGCVKEEECIEGTCRRAFVAATGDEIGMYGEGSTPEEAARELQARLSDRILAMLEEKQSHCLPSKRKYQDVLLKDFEDEMTSHNVSLLSPPRYVPIRVAFGMTLNKPREDMVVEPSGNASIDPTPDADADASLAPSPAPDPMATSVEPPNPSARSNYTDHDSLRLLDSYT